MFIPNVYIAVCCNIPKYKITYTQYFIHFLHPSLSIYLSICPYIYLMLVKPPLSWIQVHQTTRFYFWTWVSFIHLSIYIHPYLSVHISIYSHLYLSISLSIYQSICPYIYLCKINLPFHLCSPNYKDLFLNLG